MLFSILVSVRDKVYTEHLSLKFRRTYDYQPPSFFFFSLMYGGTFLTSELLFDKSISTMYEETLFEFNCAKSVHLSLFE